MTPWTKRPYVKKKMEWWNNHPGQQTNRPKSPPNAPKTPKTPKPPPQINLSVTSASIKELATLNNMDESNVYRLVMKFVQSKQVVRKRVKTGTGLDRKTFFVYEKTAKGTPYLYEKTA